MAPMGQRIKNSTLHGRRTEEMCFIFMFFCTRKHSAGSNMDFFFLTECNVIYHSKGFLWVMICYIYNLYHFLSVTFIQMDKETKKKKS